MTTDAVEQVVVDDAMVDRGARAMWADVARESWEITRLRMGRFDDQPGPVQRRWRRWAKAVLEGAVRPEDGTAAS